MDHNGDSWKKANNKFSNQSEYDLIIQGQLKGLAAKKKHF